MKELKNNKLIIEENLKAEINNFKTEKFNLNDNIIEFEENIKNAEIKNEQIKQECENMIKDIEDN